MAIEAPVSKFKKANLKIYIGVCIALSVWCAYDGYFNEKWIKDHTDAQGNAKLYLVVNRRAPYYLIGAGLGIGVWLYFVGKKKVTAEENELIVSSKLKIPYESIAQVNKTHFDSKGYYTITYKDTEGKEAECELSSKKYDNLQSILDHLISKIS